MLRKLLPVLLGLVGLGLGAGAGILLRPPPAEPAAEAAPPPATEKPRDYVRMNNQFVVPVVEDGRVVSLVILSLSLEVETGGSEGVYAREPKLRDAFLQILFDHANTGGFRGSFTDGSNMTILRAALREAAVRVLGPLVTDVLIVDIVRQDS